MTIDVGNFRLERSYGVAPERLWHLLTDAEARSAWSGPSDDDVLVVEAADVTEGGVDRHRCGPAEAPEWTATTRWYRLAPQDAATFTEMLEAGGMRLAVSLVDCALEPSAGGTRLVVHVSAVSFVGPEALAEVEAGWTSALGRLERIAAADEAPAGSAA